MQLTPPGPAGRCLSRSEAAAGMAALPGWRLEGGDDGLRLVREYRLADFTAALALAVRIGGLAAQQDHHPELTVGWGRLGVVWWTHVLHGVHENDFLMAAACDALAEGPPAA